MKIKRKSDPAEKWLAQQILTPAEYEIFIGHPAASRDQLKHKLFDEIRNLISRSNQDSPPFRPEKLFSYRKIQKVLLDEKLTLRESLLIPAKEGFFIKLNPNKPNVRIRYNCSHEIGHSYFFDTSMNPPQKVYPTSLSRYWVEEGYASDIAREILAPDPYFRNRICQLCKNSSLFALLNVRNEFLASFDVIAKRLLHDAHSWNRHFWYGHLWEAIILIANRVSPHKDSGINIRVFRSPIYKHKLTTIKRNAEINALISNVIRNKELIDRFVKIGKKHYRVQASAIDKVDGMAILIISKD